MTEPEEIYRVVFAGNLTGDFPPDVTKARFARAFKLTQKKVDLIFGGKEFTLKSRLSENGAMEFAVKLAEIGCETYIEAIILNDPKSDPNFVEHRRTILRIRFRRGPRPGAIVPDRRFVTSRRQSDLDEFEKYGIFPGITIGPTG
jgi:hypothetical protein